ncbi:CRIB domain-containing protein RIC2-like [Phalaenopsis equestris]|nr:CRIB domain-containing protein RIC2-like [Phalaenopsis equestris]
MAKGLSGAINISAGIHKAVMKGIKSFSQLFFERDREDEFDIKEIGYPTDVQHLAHVGADGSSMAGLDAMDGCGRAPDQLSFFLPPLALRQFELAMNHA